MRKVEAKHLAAEKLRREKWETEKAKHLKVSSFLYDLYCIYLPIYIALCYITYNIIEVIHSKVLSVWKAVRDSIHCECVRVMLTRVY